jgi:hypothetical protein
VVGVVSLTEARSITLIGVFISVTTIPAAADIGVSPANGSGSEAGAPPCSSFSTSLSLLPLPSSGSRSSGLSGSGPPGGPPLRHRLTTQPGLVSPADHGQACWPASPAPEAVTAARWPGGG